MNIKPLMNLKNFALLSCTLLCACSTAPKFEAPEITTPQHYTEGQVPNLSHWKVAKPLEGDARGQWWTVFNDDKLNELEVQALLDNQTLKAAGARVDEARALVRMNAANFLPNFDLGANAVRAKTSSASLAAFGSAPGTTLPPYNLYDAQGVLSYELDLFGRARDTEEGYRFDADAQAATYQSTLLMLQADVAQDYFSLRELDSELHLLRDAVRLRKEALQLMQRRYHLGDATEEDLSRAINDLAATEADLLGVQQNRSTFEHALAVLLGKLPEDFHFADAPLKSTPPFIPAGIPSELLQRRPDVAKAIASMAAANVRIGVARTAFLPNIMLSVSGGFESITLGDLFKWPNRAWALGQTAGNAITQNVFNNGRDLGQVKYANAAYDESLANYRQAILMAFQQVEDNLSAQKILEQQLAQLQKAARAADKTYALTKKRYDIGDASYFEMISSERDALSADRAALQARGQRFITTVTLIRALGGTWG